MSYTHTEIESAKAALVQRSPHIDLVRGRLFLSHGNEGSFVHPHFDHVDRTVIIGCTTISFEAIEKIIELFNKKSLDSVKRFCV